MPTYQLTSPRTGRTYGVQATAELPDDDIDALVNDLDFEAAREAGVQPGVDPAVLQQGPVGTFFGSFPNTFSKIGSETIGGVGRMLDKASESLSQATGLPKGGDMFQRMADYGDELSSSADITFPKNPLNPVAGALGSGAAQGLSLLAGGLAGKALTGSNVAMTAVPMASGFLAGANEGVQSAERIGVQSAMAQLGMGVGFGAIEMLTERLGGLGSKAGTEMLTQTVRKTAAEMAKQAGKSVGTEAFEELLAGASQDALTRLAASEDRNNPGYTTTGIKLDDLAAEIVNLEKRKLEAIGGAAGGTVFAGAQALANRSLPPNDTPLPSQSPPSSAQPAAAAPPVAGTPAGAPLTPLTGIAARGGRIDPTLPEDTGGLTAEEVQDLEGQVGNQTPRPRQPILQGVPDQVPSSTQILPTAANPDPAQTITGANVQTGTEMPVPPPTAEAGAGAGAVGDGQSVSQAGQNMSQPDTPNASVTTPGPATTADKTAQQAGGAGSSPAAGTIQPGDVVSYEGYVGELQPEGERLIVRQVDGTVVDVADPSAVQRLPVAEANRFRLQELRQLQDPQVYEAAFAPTNDGTLTIRDSQGNSYVPHNQQLLRSVRQGPQGVEVLLRDQRQPGRVIKLTGAQAQQAQEAILAAAINVEQAGGKVRYGTLRPGFTNLNAGNRQAGFNTLIPEAADALVNMASAAVRAGQTFAQWTQAMIRRFGAAVRQYLQGAWQAAMRTSQTGALNFTSRLGEQLQRASQQAASRLRKPASRATPAAMASDPGAAQNIKPSPGGLTEAELLTVAKKVNFEILDQSENWGEENFGAISKKAKTLKPGITIDSYGNAYAVEKGKLIGYILGEQRSDNVYIATNGFVVPEMRGAGIASKMLTKQLAKHKALALSSPASPSMVRIAIRVADRVSFARTEEGESLMLIAGKNVKDSFIEDNYGPFEVWEKDFAVNPESSRAAGGTSPRLPVSQSPRLESAPLKAAYASALRGSSTAMIPLADVFAAAQAANPALTQEQFQAQVMADYDAGSLMLEGAGSPQEAQSAGLRIDGTPVGTAVRMMVAPQANASQSLSSPPSALRSSTLDNGSPDSLFTYDARPETSLTPNEREALAALRNDPEFRPFRLTPVKLTGVSPGANVSPRGNDTRTRALEAWSQAFQTLFKKSVLFVEGLPASYNGAVAPDQRNVLMVNVGGRDPLLYTLGHELTHAIAKQQPELYDALEAEVLAQGTDLDSYRQRLRNLNYKPGELNEEMVADFIGAQMMEPGFLNRVAQEKPTLFQRFARAVVRFLNTLLARTKTFGRDIRPHFQQNLEALRDSLATALRTYAESGQFPDNPVQPAATVDLTQTNATAQRDADYMAAVQAGDMQTAQRMVDEAAKAAGYNLSHRWSSSRKTAKEDKKNSKHVVLFADINPNATNAQKNFGYGENEIRLRSEDLEDVPDWATDWAENEFGLSYGEAEEALNPPSIVDGAGMWDNAQDVSSFWIENESRLLKEGIYGFKTDDGAVVFDPYSAPFKSADPVTYDDNGNVIPLSQRFRSESSDIRYSRTFDALATVLPLHKTGKPFRVKNIALRRVLTGSPLPSELVGVLDMTENERQAVMQSSAQIARDLESAVNAHAKRTGRKLADIWADVNTVMEGQPGALMLLRATDPDLAEFSRRARNLLDELSDAVAQTLPAGELRNTIVQNMGQWMRRGYAAFDPEADWNYDSVSKAAAAGKMLGGKDARKILANAQAYLRRQNPQGGRTVKEWDADIEADMRDLMDRDQWEAAMADGATVRKGVSSFMKRKDIPAEIRALMGEETNPLIRYARSAKFQAQIIARHHGQIAMRNLGLTTGLFSTERGGVYTEQVPVDTRWSGLNGVWTTPQLMEALRNTSSTDLAGRDIGDMLVNSLKALGNEAKLNKVALNPGSWVVNILGNVVAVVQSGDVFYHDFIRKVNDARGILRSGKVATTAAAAALGDAQREMLQRLRAAGVTGSMITLADIEASLPRHLLAWAADDAKRNAALGAAKGAIFGQSLGRVLGAPGRIVGGAIGAAAGAKIGVKQIQAWQEAIANYVMTGPDALARVTGWLTNYETALASGLTPDQANAQATEKTLNTFPNYQKLPALLRSLSRIGFAGSFIAFQYEVYRNYGWNVAYAVREINSGNPAQRARGFRRLAGLVAVSSLAAGGLGALLTASGLASGADDERNKLFRKWFGRPWEKDAVLAFSKFDGDKVAYYNTSYLLPQVTMVELAQAVVEGASPEDSAARVVSRLWEQFGAGSVHLGPLLEAYTGQTKDGFPISNKETALGRAADRVDYVVGATMESGFSAQFERIARALLNLPKDGRSYTVEGEIKYLAGMREQTREWEKLVAQRYGRFSRDYTAARNQAKAAISENAWGAKPQAVQIANERIARLQGELQQYEKDLARLGIAPAIIRRAREASRVPKLRPLRLTKDGNSVEADPKAPLVPVR